MGLLSALLGTQGAGIATISSQQILSNKTLSNPVVNAPTVDNINGHALAGFLNRFINSMYVFDQRNQATAQTFTAGGALAYSVDRWYGYCTGANVSGQRVDGSGTTPYLYQFTGAAGVTKIGFAQRIEANNSLDMAGSTATLSVELANSLLTTVTWTAWYANTADTFGTLASPTRTQIATGTFTINSALSKYSAQISIPSAATTGIEVELSVGAQTSGTWKIGRAQLEPGAQSSPFEFRDMNTEFSMCRRYRRQTNVWAATGSGAGAHAGIAILTTGLWCPIRFDTPMRTAPTNTLWNNGVQNQFRNTATGATITGVAPTAFNANNPGGFSAIGFGSAIFTAGTYVDFDVISECEL